MSADLTDRTDFDNANRGLIARLEPGVIKAADGRVVYDADVFARTMEGDCPDTVHPSLWRQSQLTAIQGLYEVTEGIYQVRGLDLSNMTLVEGDTGRDRDRPADLGRGGGGRAGAVPRAPRRPAGHRGDLHPLPHRPFRRCARRGRRRHRRPDRRAGSTSWNTRCRRTSTPASAMLRRGDVPRRHGPAGQRRPARSGSGSGPARPRARSG